MTYRFVPNYALRALQIALLVEAIVRGLNYLVTPEAASTVYTQVEQSAPLTVWGAIFITCGVLGLFGEALLAGTTPSSRWDHAAWPSFVAHIGLMVLFGAFAVSAVFGVAEREPMYGFVTPYDMAFFALGHWAYARRRKHV